MFISGPYGFITVPRNVENYQRVFVQGVFPTGRSRYRLTSTEGLALEFHSSKIKFFCFSSDFWDAALKNKILDPLIVSFIA